MRLTHKLSELAERDAFAQKIRNDPEIEGPLRQPEGFLNRQKHAVDVVHRFEAVHRRVVPNKTLALNPELLAPVLNRCARFAVPHLRTVVVGLRLANEIDRLLDGGFSLTRKTRDHRRKGHDAALA